MNVGQGDHPNGIELSNPMEGSGGLVWGFSPIPIALRWFERPGTSCLERLLSHKRTLKVLIAILRESGCENTERLRCSPVLLSFRAAMRPAAGESEPLRSSKMRSPGVEEGQVALGQVALPSPW